MMVQGLQKVSTNFFSNSVTEQWKEPFNQATFFNFDVNSPIYINKWKLGRAITDPVTGEVYPTYLEIALNVGEINDSNFQVDTKNSATGNWQVIYTQYLGVQ